MHIQREAYKMCLQNTEIFCAVAQTNAEQASRPFAADTQRIWQSWGLSLHGGSAFLMRMPFPEPSIFQGKKWNSIVVRPAGLRPVRNIEANLAFALKFRTLMGPWLGTIATIFKYRLLCWITVQAHNSLVLSFGRSLLKHKMFNAPDNRAKFLVLPFFPFAIPNPGSITWDTQVGLTESQSCSVFPN